MKNYRGVKIEEEDVLQAGLEFLNRSRYIPKDLVMKVDTKIKPMNTSTQRSSDDFSAKDIAHRMLMTAVEENDRESSHYTNHNREEAEGPCKEYSCSRGSLLYKRRGAVSEEQLLERDGLLRLLKKYRELLALQFFGFL